MNAQRLSNERQYLQIVKEPIGGEAVKWAKAAKAPFPSNQRPRSIIANGGGDTVQCAVGALVAE